MKTIATVLALSGLALGGIAYAAESGPQGRDRTVTRADMTARAGAMFDRMDLNKDGKLDAADRAARRTAMFDRMDANKDGQLSRAEFSAGGPAMRGREGRMGARMLDADRDGSVARQEFVAGAENRFDRMDANRDGSVTPDERRAARAQVREHMRGMAAPGGIPQSSN